MTGYPAVYTDLDSSAEIAERRPKLMRRSSRLVVAVVSLALALLFVLPLWHIGLSAPQYPEGLGLYISINKIVGAQPQDLNSINGLNHYIGMKRITPEDIPELRFMPYAVLGLLALGLLTALIGDRRILYGYTAVFCLGLAAAVSLSVGQTLRTVLAARDQPAVRATTEGS